MLSETKLDLSQATSSVAHPGRQLFPHIWFSPFPLCTCLVLFALLLTGNVAAESLVLETSANKATAGYFQLSWRWPNAPAGVIYQLKEKRLADDVSNSASVVIYQGEDIASIISGKPDGRYEYQVVAHSGDHANNTSSNTIIVAVAHHSLTDAFIILSIGVAIFIAILIAILRGSYQTD